MPIIFAARRDHVARVTSASGRGEDAEGSVNSASDSTFGRVLSLESGPADPNV